jgi:hypothetical protein
MSLERSFRAAVCNTAHGDADETSLEGNLVLKTLASEDSFEEATTPFGYALRGSYTSPGPYVPLAAHATVAGLERDVERCRRAVNYRA